MKELFSRRDSKCHIWEAQWSTKWPLNPFSKLLTNSICRWSNHGYRAS